VPTTLKDFKIVKVETPSEIKRFLDVPYDIYRGQAAWMPPLRIERKEQLDPKKNPSARNLDRQLFLAVKDGRDVGRIAAFTNPVHDKQHDAETAFFGYFDAIDDVNEEVGLLIDGFEHPNVILMPYGRPYYPPAVEAAGFVKAVDMLAFEADFNAGFPRPKITQVLTDYAQKSDSITWRQLNSKDFDSEIARAMDVFNDAWAENWGFLPFMDEDLQHLAKEMKPLIVPERFILGSIDGELAGFVCMLPDINELADGFDGKLLPFNWAKLVYRLKTQKAKKARLPLMGLRRKYHGTRKGLAMVTAIFRLDTRR